MSSSTSTSGDLEAGTMSQVMQSVIPGASPKRGQVVTSLFVLSSFTALFALTAVFQLAAAGPVFSHYKDGYYIILAAILAAAAVEVAMAFWLAFSNSPCVLRLARIVLGIAYLLLIVVLALGGFALPIKVMISSVH